MSRALSLAALPSVTGKLSQMRSWSVQVVDIKVTEPDCGAVREIGSRPRLVQAGIGLGRGEPHQIRARYFLNRR